MGDKLAQEFDFGALLSNPVFSDVGGIIIGFVIGFIIGFLLAFFKFYWRHRHAIATFGR